MVGFGYTNAEQIGRLKNIHSGVMAPKHYPNNIIFSSSLSNNAKRSGGGVHVFRLLNDTKISGYHWNTSTYNRVFLFSRRPAIFTANERLSRQQLRVKSKPWVQTTEYVSQVNLVCHQVNWTLWSAFNQIPSTLHLVTMWKTFTTPTLCPNSFRSLSAFARSLFRDSFLFCSSSIFFSRCFVSSSCFCRVFRSSERRAKDNWIAFRC